MKWENHIWRLILTLTQWHKSEASEKCHHHWHIGCDNNDEIFLQVLGENRAVTRPTKLHVTAVYAYRLFITSHKKDALIIQHEKLRKVCSCSSHRRARKASLLPACVCVFRSLVYRFFNQSRQNSFLHSLPENDEASTRRRGEKCETRQNRCAAAVLFTFPPLFLCVFIIHIMHSREWCAFFHNSSSSFHKTR